jgi:uncharacterized phage-associated protein
MATVFDVAKYILTLTGPITTMKLQKLVYYSQAWSLVWDEKPLFNDRIEAWANGPVTPALYYTHRGIFQIDADSIDGDIKHLTKTERETIQAVVKGYGKKSSQWLIELSHSETPWNEARGGLENGARGNSVISHASMAEYYSSLFNKPDD